MTQCQIAAQTSSSGAKEKEERNATSRLRSYQPRPKAWVYRSPQRLAHQLEHAGPGFGGHWLFAAFVAMLDQFLRDFLQEAGWMAGHKLAKLFAAGAMAQGQRFHRARDRDIKEAPLLIEVGFAPGVLLFRPGMRQQPFFEA